MKIGASTWVWASPLTDEIVATLFPKIKALGFDWIEIPIEKIDDIDVETTKEILGQLQFAGSSLCTVMDGPTRDLLDSNATNRASCLQYIKDVINIAHEFGSSKVLGPMYSSVGRLWLIPPDERKRYIEKLVPYFRELSDFAAERNVELAIEPVNRYETSFINTAEQALELVEAIDRDNCGIILDMFHANIEERSIGRSIRTLGKRLVHVHAMENDRGVVGTGHTPWDEIIAALQDIGYDDAMVVETFSHKVEAIAAAAAIWRSFADSQDELAAEGLAFLRDKLRSA